MGILFNCRTPIHVDRNSGSVPNLVTSLSLHDGGEIEGDAGPDYQEYADGWVKGTRFSLQLQAVRFEANRRLHCTCEY